jgi:hypothetical protein
MGHPQRTLADQIATECCTFIGNQGVRLQEVGRHWTKGWETCKGTRMHLLYPGIAVE